MILSARIDLFQRGGVQILKDVRLEIERGQHWILLGPNGSGKSSLIKLLTLYEWPTAGSIDMEGFPSGEISAAAMREQVSLFEPALQIEIGHHYPWVTAEEIVVTGRTGSLMLFREADERDMAAARDILEREGFDPRRQFSIMSSGEQRRTLLLRSLFKKPALLILDEPYESLDIKARWSLEGTILRTMAEVGCTSITALHRLDEIPPAATHACLIRGGTLIGSGEIEATLTSETVSRLYDVPIRLSRSRGRFHYEPAS